MGAAGEDEQRVVVDGEDQAVGDRAHRAADLGRRGGRRAVESDHFGVAAEFPRGLTLRAVAPATEVSTGMPAHYFPTNGALITHALDLLESRTAGHPSREHRTRPGHPMPLDILPLTAGDTASDRIWVSSRKTCRSPTTGRPPSRRTGTPGCAPRSVLTRKPRPSWANSPRTPARNNSPGPP
ncbi:hypothetical protein [Streptomyces griseoluteus]|uniref:hypothetical protein n=1 Tax=Streptomyces griseoluteus TaxID=29306 RepID=UPI00382F31EE